MSPWITIVGSSARAAASSAVRAGFCVRAADRFGDADLGQLAHTTQVLDYPRGLAAVLGESHPGPWLYTGGLENRPALIRALTRQRPLWGNPPEVLRLVRNPGQVAEALRAAGLPAPLVCAAPDSLPLDGTWMRKPLRSAGGSLIAVWDQHTAQQPATQRCYYQQRIVGQACSAAYVACRGQARLLGVTRQLIGHSWTGAGPWQYAGSIGPWQGSPSALDQFRRIGDTLAQWGQLQGLFGVDAVVNERGVWPIEVNPRYTSSMEVLERAGNFSAIGLHAVACQQQELPEASRAIAPPATLPGWFGKAVWFTQHRLTMTGPLVQFVQQQGGSEPGSWPCLADLPVINSELQPGWPVMTVFAAGESESEVLRRLQLSVDRLRQAASIAP